MSSFSSRGLETGYITSTSDAAKIEKVVNGKCQLVYFTPEAKDCSTLYIYFLNGSGEYFTDLTDAVPI